MTWYHPRGQVQIETLGRYQWDFGVVDGSTVNAFALPGKIVRVTLCVLLARKVAKFLLIKGSMYCSFWFCVSRCYGNSPLLKQLKPSEGELAALLAHEIGHVICRHSQARIIQRQVVAMVLKALSYEDDDAHNENFGEAVCGLLLKSADWMGHQAFSRKDEYQADAVGWELLKPSGLNNPQALQSILAKLWELHGRRGGDTSWESTHPGTLDRIEVLNRKWNDLPLKERRRIL